MTKQVSNLVIVTKSVLLKPITKIIEKFEISGYTVYSSVWQRKSEYPTLWSANRV